MVFKQVLQVDQLQMGHQVDQVEVLVPLHRLHRLQKINQEQEIHRQLVQHKVVMVVLVHIHLQIMEEVVAAELLLLVQMDQDLLQVMAEQVLQLQ